MKASVNENAIDRRRHALMARVRAAAMPRFDAQGNWIAPETPPGYRERQWHCMCLLHGEADHIARANGILENNPADRNDFQAFFAALLPRVHGDKLSPAARDGLLADLRAIADHSYRHLFRYTENCGLMNAFAQLEAGRLFDEPARIERGRLFLEAAVHAARQFGVMREYFSVNYLGVTLSAAACIAGLAADESDRALGNELQAHLWGELAAVWHPNLHWTAGPSGRSYTENSIAAFSGLHLMAWLGFGEPTCRSPMDLGMFDDGERAAKERDSLPFSQAAMGWRAAIPYSVPDDALRLSREKPLPYQLNATTEVYSYREFETSTEMSAEETRRLGGWYSRGGSTSGLAHIPSRIVHPRGRTHVSCYMAEDYGLGAATQQMTAQSDTLYAAWRRVPEVSHLSDIRTLYLRYTVNGTLEDMFAATAIYPHNIPERGRGGAAQSGPLGVAWYAADDLDTNAITRLRTSVLLSEWFGPIDEVLLGDARVETNGVLAAPGWVFLRDGDSFVGLHPLLTVHEEGRAVTVRRLGRFRVITFANVDGPPRDFHPAALRQVGGGAIVFMGSSGEYGDFAAFRDVCRAAEIRDDVYESQRHIACTCDGRSLELIWDMQTETILWMRDESGFISEQRFAHGAATR